ncbi:hypothetical protein C8R41DRAFT_922691 [Lentinula lateritia]|uniref:Uncharacterized protein n=1 Tax=Lentinula lateritia TaxID=40482 RepID=A0ABQ8V838_9AGAR|nr:hypothetical protein C8R41DRAFT_922691 [Lentinula lateritia]
MSLNHSYPPDVYGEAYAYYNQNSYAHHDPQLSSPLDEAYSQFSPDDITGGSFITSPGNEVPTADTGAIRPVVFTDFSYTPGSQPSSWPESAYTQFSSSPYSPFPPTPGVSTYESNQSSGHLYQNSPTNYSILQGEMSPGFRIIDPQGHYTAYPDTTAPPADEGLTMISPSSLTSFEFGLKKATVASTKSMRILIKARSHMPVAIVVQASLYRDQGTVMKKIANKVSHLVDFEHTDIAGVWQYAEDLATLKPI